MIKPSIDELFERALSGEYDNDAAWEAISDIHFLGTEEVLNRAIELTQSENALHRARGADILGQLGVKRGEASTLFIPERRSVLVSLLQKETDPLIIEACIAALGYFWNDNALHSVISFQNHANKNVRFVVARALGSFKDPASIEPLIKLSRDPDSDIRDWATFGLGTQHNDDTPSIRQALLDRLTDDDLHTREEAIKGLVQRSDDRAVPVLIKHLEDPDPDIHLELHEAAISLLGLDENVEYSSEQLASALRLRLSQQ